MRRPPRWLACVALAALAACAGSDGTNAQTTDPQTRDAAPVTPPAQAAPPAVVATVPDDPTPLLRYGSEAVKEFLTGEAWIGDFDGMVERRLIRALVPYSKTYYFLDGVNQRGTAYEGMSLFEDWINDELGTGALRFHVVLIPTSRDLLLPALVEGYGDLALGGLTVTPERAALVDFSDPLMRDVSEIVITGPAAAPLATVDDLSGREVYVRESSSYYASLAALNERFETSGRPPMTLTLAEEYLEDEDLLEMLDSGLIETIVVDQHKAEFWDQIFDNITLHPDVAVREHGAIATAFRKNSPQLADVLNRFVAEHRQGTLMGNIILRRYLQDTTRMRNAFSTEDQALFQSTVGLFETYAPQYGFDHLMMVAQGYQESQLDQSRMSNRGAVGIMQLLPSTAADAAVDIPDISSADSNVHAGIRYMRWIRDTYFDDDTVDDVNKTLFSFASYNAGPNRIRRLRTETADQGLDPNIWFRNVEIVVAENIGRETVHYVSQIYKYYAGYKLLGERQARSRR